MSEAMLGTGRFDDESLVRGLQLMGYHTRRPLGTIRQTPDVQAELGVNLMQDATRRLVDGAIMRVAVFGRIIATEDGEQAFTYTYFHDKVHGPCQLVVNTLEIRKIFDSPDAQALGEVLHLYDTLAMRGVLR